MPNDPYFHRILGAHFDVDCGGRALAPTADNARPLHSGHNQAPCDTGGPLNFARPLMVWTAIYGYKNSGPKPAFFLPRDCSDHMSFRACMAAVTSPKIWVSQILPSASKSQLS